MDERTGIVAAYDQARELVMDTLPVFLIRFRDKLIEEGFNYQEAMFFCKTYLEIWAAQKG